MKLLTVIAHSNLNFIFFLYDFLSTSSHHAINKLEKWTNLSESHKTQEKIYDQNKYSLHIFIDS